MLDSLYVKHELPGHIERPDRVRSIATTLGESGLEERCKFVPARKATKAEVLLAHSPQVCTVFLLAPLLSTSTPTPLLDGVWRYRVTGSHCH